MKRTLLLTLAIATLFLAACEKDDGTSPTNNPDNYEKEYSVIKYKNNYLNAKYVFTETKLRQLEIYSDLGELEYSSAFHYHDNRLDSMTRNYVNQNVSKTTKYYYSSNDKLNKIELRDFSPFLKTYTINYDNSGLIQKVKWDGAAAFSGEFTFGNYGNVNEYKYNYSYSSDVRNNESNWVSFDQFPNVTERFWVTEPTMEYLSINNPIEQLQTTSIYTDLGSGAGGTWEYVNKSWDFEYTYNEDGFVLTQTVLDSGNAVVNMFEYEYSGF